MQVQNSRYGGLGGKRAVVVGASSTGLAAAAAAARHFDQVVVLERDVLPDQPEWRKGVPQGRHVHVLLRSGQNVFNHYFPGLTQEMVAGGATQVDMGRDCKWHHSGGWKVRFTSGLTMQCQSKAFLEWSLRQRLQQFPNVEMRSKAGVRGLVVQKGRLEAVDCGDGEHVEADLFIDASGRGSEIPRLLEAAGLGAVPVSDLPVDVGYASRLLRPTDDPRDWLAMLIHPRHPQTRMAGLFPVEGGRWLLTLVGWRGDHPGGDDDSFLEWTKGLAVPDCYKLLRKAEPLSPIYRWRFGSNLRRHYERMPGLPDNLVCVGDANTSLNPIYAQGQSHGAVGASILDESLYAQRRDAGRVGLDGFSRRFHKAYARFLNECWFASTTEDYSAADQEDQRPWYAPMASRYLRRVHELTWSEEHVARRFYDVMHMQAGASRLLAPSVMWPVIAAKRPRPTVAPRPVEKPDVAR